MYPKGNSFDFGESDGKFVWGDLKDSKVVGSYPYPKNDPKTFPYWNNIGASDSLYGGITVYTFDDGNTPIVKKDGEKYQQ